MKDERDTLRAGWHSSRKAFRWKTGRIFTIVVSSPRKYLQNSQNLRITVPLLYGCKKFQWLDFISSENSFPNGKVSKKVIRESFISNFYTPTLFKSSPWPKCFCSKANPRGRSPTSLRIVFAENYSKPRAKQGASSKIHPENQQKPLAARHVVNALLTPWQSADF